MELQSYSKVVLEEEEREELLPLLSSYFTTAIGTLILLVICRWEELTGGR